MYSDKEYMKGVRKRQKEIRDFDKKEKCGMAKMRKQLGIKKIK